MTAAQALHRLAEAAGIALKYKDNTSRERTASDDSLRACLAAMEITAGTEAEAAAALEEINAARKVRRIPEWLVVNSGEASRIGIGAESEWRIETEAGKRLEGRGDTIPALPLGRHRLTCGPETCWILSAPPALPLPAPGWGVTLPLYGLRAPSRGGIGDYADLEQVVRGLAKLGAGFVGINPVHAELLGHGTISPYSPSHRRRFATAHVHAASEPPGEAGALVDYGPALESRRAALEAEYRDFTDEDGAFAAFLFREGRPLAAFTSYQAIAEVHGATWDRWPAELRDARSSAVSRIAAERVDRQRFHAWLQFQADRQLAQAAAAARQGGMAHGLYLDLAVGTHPHGAETWAEPESFARGVSLGAPPDAFAENGQNWNLAPFNPRTLVAEGFAPLAATLRAQLRHAGMLRVDHILGFERAFWVPDGDAGTYLSMPRDAMLAVLRIEAARAGAVVVGEDLGNVPAGLRDALAASGILGCEVAMFTPGRAADDYREAALISFSTHDLPTWAGWREGRDIAARAKIGGLDGAAVTSAMADRAADVERIDARLAASPTVDALHGFLAETPVRLVALQAEDLLSASDQANLPGTVDEHPNWRRRLPVGPTEFAEHPRVRAAARLMAAAGRSGTGAKAVPGV